MYYLELSQILTSVLAIAAIVQIVTQERAFHWLHRILGDQYDDDGNIFGLSNNPIAYLFRCRVCLSVWVAILVYMGWLFFPKITTVVLSPFMLAQLTWFFSDWLEKHYG